MRTVSPSPVLSGDDAVPARGYRAHLLFICFDYDQLRIYNTISFWSVLTFS